MWFMMEYNRLTVKLLSEGYTAEKYPDYEHQSRTESQQRSYTGFAGYQRWYTYKL